MATDLDTINAKLDRILALLGDHPAQPKPDVLTVELSAPEVGRGTDWVYDQIRRRRIKPCRIGKPYRIPRSELFKLTLAHGPRAI